MVGWVSKVPTRLSLGSALLWAGYAAYWGVVLLGTQLPGDPIQSTNLATIQELIDESLNFFYVTPALNAVGFTLIPSPVCHPVRAYCQT
jgi:hypothetical protein